MARSLPPVIGIVVGMQLEAGLARPLGGIVAVGGGSRAGAQRAAEGLVERGATALVSFGVAGGLDPALPPGALLVPGAVLTEERCWPVDPALAASLGGMGTETVFGGVDVLEDVAAKRRLRAASGAAAVDLESGAVAVVAARHRLPFAVLRAVCDPAGRPLPPAAARVLDGAGRVRPGRVLAELAKRPWHIPRLIALGREMEASRAALRERVRQVGRLPPAPPRAAPDVGPEAMRGPR